MGIRPGPASDFAAVRKAVRLSKPARNVELRLGCFGVSYPTQEKDMALPGVQDRKEKGPVRPEVDSGSLHAELSI
jgi:hypothetical protein